MMRFVVDENLNNDIIRGLRRRQTPIDIVRVQDVGLYSSPDPDVLEWAAENDRILLTHDVSTIPKYACDRIRSGNAMPGVVIVPQDLAIGRVICDLIFIVERGLNGAWESQILYLPIDQYKLNLPNAGTTGTPTKTTQAG